MLPTTTTSRFAFLRIRGNRLTGAVSIQKGTVLIFASSHEMGSLAVLEILLDARLCREVRVNNRNKFMLWTILVILLVLWLVGLLGHVGGAFIHLLLVIALIVLILNLVRGRRPL